MKGNKTLLPYETIDRIFTLALQSTPAKADEHEMEHSTKIIVINYLIAPAIVLTLSSSVSNIFGIDLALSERHKFLL